MPGLDVQSNSNQIVIECRLRTRSLSQVTKYGENLDKDRDDPVSLVSLIKTVYAITDIIVAVQFDNLTHTETMTIN